MSSAARTCAAAAAADVCLSSWLVSDQCLASPLSPVVLLQLPADTSCVREQSLQVRVVQLQQASVQPQQLHAVLVTLLLLQRPWLASASWAVSAPCIEQLLLKIGTTVTGTTELGVQGMALLAAAGDWSAVSAAVAERSLQLPADSSKFQQLSNMGLASVAAYWAY